ncbi:uncharacterized protein LOC128894287 [Hylaeus anthracinus]|uniref:uncharacterized protein LOC128894287 n=1 Tax=Hylaeus anthracinus TaxID=313031 RepID=UPI0023B9EDDA|nr:uncharacterized protein LOC128894287 [Hylaeus anthracinus]XP_054011921.1 uncharacterized protein LOC128894287 [Hylaeus anthracinus]
MKNIHSGAKAVYDIIAKKAVNEEKTMNAENVNPPIDISVSGDGTWKKRGYNSLFGIATLIGKYTGKVVNLVVKSSYCHACKLWESQFDTEAYDDWFEEHSGECTSNHNGSAGKMEVDGITEMFRRSWEIHEVRYAKYIGDGDTKTFKILLKDKPYGDDMIVTKKECVGHVEKHMGSRLRSDKLIKELIIFYGLAIRRHPKWATFYHKISRNENPQHMYCPVGSQC